MFFWLLLTWKIPNIHRTQVAQSIKTPPAIQEMQETWVWSLGREDPLEKGMATHSSILAWRIPWTEHPGGLQSMGSQTVKHDWSDLAHMQFQHVVIIWCFLIYRFTPTSFFVCSCWQIHPLFYRVPCMLIFMFESNGVIYHVPLLPVSLPVPSSRSRESFLVDCSSLSCVFLGRDHGKHTRVPKCAQQLLCRLYAWRPVWMRASSWWLWCVLLFWGWWTLSPPSASFHTVADATWILRALCVPSGSCWRFLGVSYHLVLLQTLSLSSSLCDPCFSFSVVVGRWDSGRFKKLYNHLYSTICQNMWL